MCTCITIGSSVVVSRERIGYHNRTAANGSDLIEYLPGEDDETVYPGMCVRLSVCLSVCVCVRVFTSPSPEGIPPDGTPHSETVTFHLSLVIIYDILAVAGIGFAVFCLTINFTYRNKKLETLSF